MGRLFKGGFLDPLDVLPEEVETLLDPAGIFAGGEAPKSATPAPEAAPQPVETLMTPTVMPTADSDAQRAARRKSLADQARRKGRQSTILTGNDDALGTTG